MLKLYFITLPILVGIDALRLGLIMKNFYKNALGNLMKTDINRIAWGAFYLLFAWAIVVFAVSPALKAQSRLQALLLWGFLGLISYGTYDLTNLATLKHRPLSVTLIDLAWGTLVCASISVIVYFIAQRYIAG